MVASDSGGFSHLEELSKPFVLEVRIMVGPYSVTQYVTGGNRRGRVPLIGVFWVFMLPWSFPRFSGGEKMGGGRGIERARYHLLFYFGGNEDFC